MDVSWLLTNKFQSSDTVINKKVRKIISQKVNGQYTESVGSQLSPGFGSLMLNPVNICLFKVKRNYRNRCEICSNLTMKTLERRQ